MGGAWPWPCWLDLCPSVTLLHWSVWLVVEGREEGGGREGEGKRKGGREEEKGRERKEEGREEMERGREGEGGEEREKIGEGI